MLREIISTDQAPAAIGPYSQAVKVGSLLFLSGQIPLETESGNIVGESAGEQCRRVLMNVQAILESVGASLNNVVKCTVFMVDLGEFQDVNRVYGEFFQSDPPARTTVQVSALPKGARIEIEVTAYLE